MLCLEMICSTVNRSTTREEALNNQASWLISDVMLVERKPNDCFSRLGVGKLSGKTERDHFADTETVTIDLI